MSASMPLGECRLTGGDRLVDVLCRDLVDRGTTLSPAEAGAVLVATRAFVATGGQSAAATRLVGPPLVRLGRRAALRGHPEPDFDRELRRVIEDRRLRAEVVLRRDCSSDERAAVAPELETYLDRVRHAALTGHRQIHALLALESGDRRAAVLRALFDTAAVPSEVLLIAGLDPVARFAPVVWLDGSGAAAAIAGVPDALVGDDDSAALLPERVRVGSVVAPGVRVVTGPARPAVTVGALLQLARQTAAALRAGVLQCSGPIASCDELADELLLAGRPALAELLAEKYLGGFAELRPARRVEVGEVLLRWLETRDPLSELATLHQIARQTAHDRLKVGKRLLGPALDCPSAHAAIVVALHARLHRWREEVIDGAVAR